MTPPELQISPSRIAQRYFVLLHLIAIIVALSLPWLWCGVAWGATILHYFRMRSFVSGSARLQALPEGQVVLVDGQGAGQKVNILPSSLVTSWLLVLHLQADSGKIALVMWPDSADEADLRRWRVWLRWTLPAMKRRIASAENAGLE